MNRLHQLEICGRRLVVVYADHQPAMLDTTNTEKYSSLVYI